MSKHLCMAKASNDGKLTENARHPVHPSAAISTKWSVLSLSSPMTGNQRHKHLELVGSHLLDSRHFPAPGKNPLHLKAVGVASEPVWLGVVNSSNPFHKAAQSQCSSDCHTPNIFGTSRNWGVQIAGGTYIPVFRSAEKRTEFGAVSLSHAEDPAYLTWCCELS